MSCLQLVSQDTKYGGEGLGVERQWEGIQHVSSSSSSSSNVEKCGRVLAQVVIYLTPRPRVWISRLKSGWVLVPLCAMF